MARKHTRFGADRYAEGIVGAVAGLTQFREASAARIKRFQNTDVSDTQAESIMLRAYEKEVVSSLLLPRLIKEWRQPLLEEFEPRTLWSLYNAFTTVLGERQKTDPAKFARLTMQVSGLLDTPSRPELSLSA